MQILTEILPLLLEDLPLYVQQSMWYQQDGCPAHFARIITELLNRKFGDRWIGRSGNNRWAARFPKFSTYGVLFVGKVKTTNVQQNTDNKRRYEGAYKKSLRCD